MGATGRARVGTAMMFFTNGVLLSALLPRLPEVKATFGLNDFAFGLLVACFPLGAICASLSAGPIIRRFGTLPVNAVGSLTLAAFIAIAGAAPIVWVFAGALIIAGASDAIVDAAQNVHAVVVERWHGRSIINRMHGVWSIGAATGGLAGAGALAAGIELWLQLLISSVVIGPLAVLAAWLARVPPEVRRAQTRPGSSSDGATADVQTGSRASLRRGGLPMLVPLMIVALCAAATEDLMNNWVVLFLTREQAPMALAGLGFTIVALAQFTGRVVGDPMTDRWGRDRLAVTGGALVVLGGLTVIFSPHYLVALVGFALIGFGSATLIPAAFAAADEIPGLPVGTGIALVGWSMRVSFLVLPLLIGAVSEATDLRAAVGLIVVAGVIVSVISLWRSRQPTLSSAAH